MRNPIAELIEELHVPLPNGGYCSRTEVIDHGDGTRSEISSSCSSEGAVQSATLALLMVKHAPEIGAWMERYASLPCADHGIVPDDGFQWSANDYVFEWDDPKGGPVFMWWGWHNNGEFCIAAHYEVRTSGGMFWR